MVNLTNSSSFDQVIAGNSFVLVFFSGKDCSVCHAIKPKIEQLVVDHFSEVKMIEISTAQLPDLSSRFSVFTVPVVLFFVEGKEYIREVRFIDTLALQQKMGKILGIYNQ